MLTIQTGGGSATHSGTDYQNRVATWVAIRILAEQNASPPWDLPAGTTLEFLRCETNEPVDDILVGNSNSGHIFIQAKHSITYGATEDSELASVVEQFVRQFLARTATQQQPSWDRPLDKGVDRLVLVTSSTSSARVLEDLPAILRRILTLSPNQAIGDAATSSADREVLRILTDHMIRSWMAIKRVAPTSQELCAVASLIRVQVLDVDAGQNQEREAKDLLRTNVLKSPSEADNAWDGLLRSCATFAANRTGASRTELQAVLTSSGIDIGAVRSYRGDIEKLKRVSANCLQSLRALSDINLSPTQALKVQRASTVELRDATLVGSLVVVGQPGAGKSGALHDLSLMLAASGDVLVFAIDQFDSGSLHSLRNELGCEHEIADILCNWPGIKPGFLIIDALDAARTEASAKTFRDLIGACVNSGSRWYVIPSIRKFDLRYSTALQGIFPGTPPSKFQDPEFKAIRHFEVPIFADAELDEIKKQSPSLNTVISNAGPELLKLLRIPFNMRLVAELIGGGASTSSISPIRTQIELLDKYWHERVIGQDMHGDAREAVLRLATREMVNKRTLRIDREVVANDPSASKPLRQIMSAQLLVEWQPSPELKPDRYVITYAHHILFDYAVERLLFRGPLNATIARLENEPDLLLAVRPSLLFHFQHLWNLDQTRKRFWDCVFAFFASTKIPATGQIIGPIAATQLITTIADCHILLTAMKDETSAHHQSSIKAFRHLAGGIPSSSHESTRPLTGNNAPPWSELLKEVSGI